MKESIPHSSNGSSLLRNQRGLLQLLEAAPDAYLILSPDLEIQLVTDAYLAVTFSKREDLLGRYIFDAFPDNPANPEANSVQKQLASLKRVLANKQSHQLHTLQYDLPKPNYLGGGFEEKYWSTLNTPVLDDAGEIIYIIHKATDVTEFVKTQAKIKDLKDERKTLQAALEQYRNSLQVEEERRRLVEAQTLGKIGNFESVYPYDNIRWSDELYRIFGLAPQSEEITVEKLSSFIHPDDQAMYQQAMHSFYKERKEVDVSSRTIRKDGTTRFLQFKAEMVRDVQGNELKVRGTVQDLTEQVKAQQKLRERERLLREAEEVGQIGSYHGDVATLTFRFSEGMFRLLGLQPEDTEITLEQIDAASHPDDAQPVREVLKKALRSKEPYEYLRRVYRPDGKMRYLQSTGKVACDKQGNAVKFIGIVQDITERKHAEEKLRQSELHFRTLVSNTPDIITRWDKDQQLVFNNEVFEAKTESPVFSLYQHERQETEHSESPVVPWEEKLKHVFQRGEMEDYYCSYLMPQGTAYYHTQLVPELGRDGTVQSVLAIARDISALRKLEQENLDLKLSQQKELLLAILDAKETERSRIAEGLHNGIGQLLYAAKLTLEQLTEDGVAEDTKKLKACVKNADQILEQAIFQTRSLSRELAPAVLNDFGLEVAFKEICSLFNSKNLRFRCSGVKLPMQLEMHLQVMVYRIAQELANNIVKHADATDATLLLQVQKGTLVLLAEDNGKGFDPEHTQGKGIGIKTIRDSVKLLNGSMSIASNPEKGTRVQVSLPLPPDRK